MVDATYQLAFKLYPYERSPLRMRPPQRHPVVVVGGGPIGMATALDLGLQGYAGSGAGRPRRRRAGQPCDLLCQAHAGDCRPAGRGQAMVDKGVVWNVGKVFHGTDQVFEFNLLPEEGHKNPAFINLQQPYFEKFLVDARARRAGQGRAD